MTAGRKTDLDRRLLNRRVDGYLADLRSSVVKRALRRGAANWQLYAAVTGSALAIASGAPASLVSSGLPELAAAGAIVSALSTRSRTGLRDVSLGNATPLTAAAQTQGSMPSIAAGGVVPLCSHSNTIQSGEWVTIFGANLANQTANWNNDFPISLGGTSVSIDGNPAYLSYVSPQQINLQVPDDANLGTVSVVVTTAAGSTTAYATLNTFAPSFSLLDSTHVSGIILRSDKSGHYGGGSYDILGPTGNSLGYPTVAARPGDQVELFAVGLGPTTPVVHAGQVFSGAAPINDTLTLFINNIAVTTTFAGLSSAGIYQVNLTIPQGLGDGELPLQALIGGMQSQPGVVIDLQSSYVPPPVGGGSSGGGVVVRRWWREPGEAASSVGAAVSRSFGGGIGGGSGGGWGGGGGSWRHKKKPYQPVLNYPPKQPPKQGPLK